MVCSSIEISRARHLALTLIEQEEKGNPTKIFISPIGSWSAFPEAPQWCCSEVP